MSDLPDDVIDTAERLTRRALAAADAREESAYRRDRDELLATYGYDARLREAPTGETLVLYPTEWIEDGTVRLDVIDDTGRAVERPLSGTGGEAEWDRVERHNRAIVDEVRSRDGPVHGANVAAFADFMGNHYVRRIETAGASEVREFLTEYFPRNAWPSEEQREVVEVSLRRAFESADTPVPAPLRTE